MAGVESWLAGTRNPRAWRLPVGRAARITLLCIAALLAATAARTEAQGWQGVVVRRGESEFYVQDGSKRPIEPPATPGCLGGIVSGVDTTLIDSLPLGEPKTDCEAAPSAVKVFDYTFDMPGQPALQHLHATISMDETGRIGGWLAYENRDNLSPYCSAIVAGVYGSDGTLLQVFTSPIRCVPAMGANGKNVGQPSTRRLPWSAQLRAELVSRAAILDVRAVATGDVKVITAAQAREALKQRTSVVSQF